MIICLYHGSTFKDVNQNQTAKITAAVELAIPTQVVIEAYYSQHVLDVMERRNQQLLGFKQALIDNYDQDKLYVLITNVMDGAEYQNILATINEIDVDNKVVATSYLLDESNIYDLAPAIRTEQPTLFIGHGNDIDNRDYERLNSILEQDDNYVTTLKSDLSAVLNTHFYNKHLTIKPLMITSAYHANQDINRLAKEVCIGLGYVPNIDLEPLAVNSLVQQLLIRNLQSLIELD